MAPETMDLVVRERRTEERVRAMDVPEIVDLVHEMEDEADRAEARVDRLEAALRPFAAFACGTSDGSGVPLPGCECANCNAARALTRTEGEG